LRAITVLAVLLMLLLVVAGPVDATYRGKNGRIAFSLDTGNGFQINTIRPNGEGLHQITSVKGSAFEADWSPDGTEIAFDVGAPEAEHGCHIETMNADGSNIVDITPKRVTGPDACAYDPSFTPDGRRIVFLAQRCTTCGLWISIMNLDGGNRRRIVHSPHRYGLHNPNVSPDGNTIAFVANRDAVVNGVQGNRSAQYTVRMDGTHMRQIVPFRFDVCSCSGDWAPNGMRIASSTQAGPTPVPGAPPNLFTVRPDGTGLRYVTHSHDTDVLVSIGSYSPDGRWIMYKRVTASGNYRLMKIHPSGRKPSLIARLPANFLNRDWGPQPLAT
jgi:Tol biopolymer transport system component